MNRTAGIIRLQFKDKWLWFYVPLLVMVPSFIVNFTISIFLDEPMYTGGIASIFIYTLVTGIVVPAQTFPFALGFSVRRTDYYNGISLAGFLASSVIAIVLLLLALIESQVIAFWGTGLHFFHLPYLNDGPPMVQLWIYFVLMLYMYFQGIVISSVFRRFGKKGTFTLFIVLILVATIALFFVRYYVWWDEILGWFAGQTAGELSLWFIPLIVVYFFLSLGLLRRSTV